MENIKLAKDSVELVINPKVYSLDVVYSAAYVFLDKAYVLLDGDPKKKIIVKLKPKKETDLEKLGLEFMNELVNYADYSKRAEKTKSLREFILKRALLTNDIIENPKEEFDAIAKGLEKEDGLEGISLPWEKKK